MTALQDEGRSIPMSDEDLGKLMVGELKPHNATITLVEYDPPRYYKSRIFRNRR